MKRHPVSVNPSDERYTPPDVFDALGMTFDLDPCSPGPDHWVPARKVYTIADDGLAQPWEGTVFMNPPFGGRNGHVLWLRKFLDHGDGIGLVNAQTSAAWFHDHLHRADALLFPRGRTRFFDQDGKQLNHPWTGVVLIGMGERCVEALRKSGLGFCMVHSTGPQAEGSTE